MPCISPPVHLPSALLVAAWASALGATAWPGASKLSMEVGSERVRAPLGVVPVQR